MDKDYLAWRRANPWIIHNLLSPDTKCGRYPTREAALEAAATYRQVVKVNDYLRIVYVSETPRL